MSSIIVEEENAVTSNEDVTSSDTLVSWVMSRVNRWRRYRDTSFQDRWDEYYRIFRGRWHVKDRTRVSERSRLVNPALATALEQTVAEMEEATFGREAWIDASEDDKGNMAIIEARDKLLNDLGERAQDSVAESYLNGALYGELIMKLVIEPKAERSLKRMPTGQLQVIQNDRNVVYWEPLEANEFVPDPSAKEIDDMLGCAHEVLRPLSWVERRQAEGIFDKGAPIMPWSGGTDPEGGDKQVNRGDLELHVTNEDAVMITEYHGLVPLRLLPDRGDQRTATQTQIDELVDKTAARSIEGEKMVEAIVTIANKSIVVKAVRNPFIMQDRSFVACQFEKVPGRFWGRGVMEKGYNPHKALDAELRARIDALALISNPMMGVDATRLPRGFDVRIRPGKAWLTNGAPKDVLQPVQFAGLEPATFNQSSELERMVNTATGAMDLNQMVRGQVQSSSSRPNATTSSLVQGAFIKRSKRAMNNVSRRFLNPLVKKTLWRYMQFEPQRYPQDYDFNVITTMGIMAKEFEQTQMTQLMGQVPDEMTVPKLLLLQAIVENSSSTVKKPLLESIRSQVEQMNNPEAQKQQQMLQQMAMAKQAAEVKTAQSKAALNEAQMEYYLSQAYAFLAKAGMVTKEMDLEQAKVFIDAHKAALMEEQNSISMYDAMTARMQLGQKNAKES